MALCRPLPVAKLCSENDARITTAGNKANGSFYRQHTDSRPLNCRWAILVAVGSERRLASPAKHGSFTMKKSTFVGILAPGKGARRRFVRPACGLATLLLLSGCGKGLPVAPVTGTITVGGKPLAGASVTTQPIATDSTNPGPGSFGRTDEQGRFELELVTSAVKGAIIGDHRVMISPATENATQNQSRQSADGQYESSSDDPLAHRHGAASGRWPREFSDGSLRLHVPPEGANDVRFDL